LIERVRLDAKRRRLAVRVCVTGTRGKSSVARLVAAALSESGLRVLAKTTGSRAVLILPDGSEKPVLRRGSPSILEQKQLVRLAVRLKADALVAEMMSIGAECLAAETRILGPQILVVTNVRLDHVDLMGPTREDIADCLARAFPRNGTIILPGEELFPVFARKAAALGSKVMAVQKKPGLPVPPGEFETNVLLALEVAGRLGIDEATALRGMKGARPDFGSLRMWDLGRNGAGPDIRFVSAFAANDPESTALALERVFSNAGLQGRRRVGLLNLRADRGDRTLQWSEALERGEFAEFDLLALAGGSSRALASRLRHRTRWTGDRLLVLRGRKPRRILDKLASASGVPAVIVGLGNIGGAGAALVETLEKMEPGHGL
jgi:gamma-polyglutamate synthase